MTSRYPTDIFGRAVGATTTAPSTSTPIDTSSFLSKSGGTMTGDINLNGNKIISSAVAVNDNDIPNKKQTEDASNLKTGSISKDRLPQTLNGFALNGNQIFIRNFNDSKGFIREFTISGASTKVFTHIDGSEGILMSVGGTFKNENYISLHDQKVFFNQRDLDHIKSIKTDQITTKDASITNKITSKDIESTNQVKFKELKSDNVTEPILLNDNGLTLDDHTLRFRGQPDNNNSIRWFNGDVTNGVARLEVSTTDRLRLSTFKGKDGVHTMKNGNRDYTGTNAQFIELLHDRLNVNNNRIVNLSAPTEDNDAVTKKYVDSQISTINKRSLYKSIIDTHKPTFWISSVFPHGFNNDKTSIQDLTGTGLTITNTVSKDLRFGLTSRITSTGTYAKQFTFFIKAKKLSTRGGRLFTSSGGNILFGWWMGNQRALWIEGEVYGLGSNIQPADTNVHTYILTSNNDLKAFYDEKSLVVSTSAGGDDWKGSVVLGQPITAATENSEFQVYEAIAFNKVLDQDTCFKIYDDVFA